MRIKIRVKFTILFVTIALLPLLVVMQIIIGHLQDIQRTNALNFAKEIASEAAGEIEAFVILQFGVLNNIETIYPEFSSDLESQERILERILFVNENFTDITVVDKNGREIRRTNRVLVITPENLKDKSDQPEFTVTRDRGRYVGPHYFEKGRPFFIIGKAIYDVRDQFQGAILAQIDARVMQDVVKRIFVLRGQRRAYIVDRRGIVLGHPDISQVLAGKDLSFIPIVREILKINAALSFPEAYRNEVGEQVFGAGAPIILSFEYEPRSEFSTGWFTIVEQPSAVALAAVRQIRLFAFLVLFIVGIISGILAFVFGGWIVVPIEKLHGVVKHFTQGILDYRVSVETNDEIEDLAHGFNAMAEKLSASIDDLRAEKNKFETVVSGITDAVIAVDFEGKVMIFNKAAESLTGFSWSEAIGKSIGQILKMFDKEQEVEASIYCPAKTEEFEGVTFAIKNARIVSSKNQERYVNLVTGSIIEGKKINLECILTLHDITREQFFEKSKSEFITIAAHQLRTPLTAIKWALWELLQENTKMSREHRYLIEKTYESNDRMIRLVGDLLNVARIEEGKFIYQSTRIDIAALIQAVLDAERENIKKQGLQLEFYKPSEPLPSIWADEDAIRIVVQNVIENSRRYTLPGGKIIVTLERHEGAIHVSVQDTGVGIPEKQQERVFTKFFRGNNVVKMETEGSGLGLFISKNIIETHGGNLWFKSEGNKGSTFTFSLPLSKKV